MKSARDDGKKYRAEIAVRLEHISKVGETPNHTKLSVNLVVSRLPFSDFVRDLNRGCIVDKSTKIERWSEDFGHVFNIKAQAIMPSLSSAADFVPLQPMQCHATPSHSEG